MLYATESNLSILKKLAMIISLKIVDPSSQPKEIHYFPKNGLKPGSIQYFPEGLLGHQFLKRGFQGTYTEQADAEAKAKVKDKAEDKEHKLFLAILKNPQDAVNALRTYKNYLTQKGKVHSDPSIGFGPNSFRGEDPYQGQIIVVQKANYLLGATGFEKAKQGDDRLTEFVRRVK